MVVEESKTSLNIKITTKYKIISSLNLSHENVNKNIFKKNTKKLFFENRTKQLRI